MSDEDYVLYLTPASKLKDFKIELSKKQTSRIYKSLAEEIKRQSLKGLANCYFDITENLYDKSLPVKIITDLTNLGYKCSIIENNHTRIRLSIFWS